MVYNTLPPIVLHGRVFHHLIQYGWAEQEEKVGVFWFFWHFLGWDVGQVSTLPVFLFWFSKIQGLTLLSPSVRSRTAASSSHLARHHSPRRDQPTSPGPSDRPISPALPAWPTSPTQPASGDSAACPVSPGSSCLYSQLFPNFLTCLPG